MESIKEIYKIGHGPSSSHTMGPRKAAEQFRANYPDASSYRITLYGSLAATGKGHFTDATIIEALSPIPAEIIWRSDIFMDYHPNALKLEALAENGELKGERTVYSVGGGSIVNEEDINSIVNEQVYDKHFMKDIQKEIDEEGKSFWEYVEEHEGKGIWDFLAKVWAQMQKTIEEGLNDDSVLPGSLHMRSKAKQYYRKAKSFRDSLQSRVLVSAYALATSEQNARGKVVVTAPTCGSCGIVPAVLYHAKHHFEFPDEDILKALATAGLFGNIIKTNASISGADVGCQGEVGSACVMASVAINQLFGGTNGQIETAAEMAMEHNLGLTCDPVCGLVLVPCIERNAMAALRALDVSLYALLGDGKHLISFDRVVDTMKRTGKDLPSLYKETALGGLATEI